jgi:hypothetical protein
VASFSTHQRSRFLSMGCLRNTFPLELWIFLVAGSKTDGSDLLKISFFPVDLCLDQIAEHEHMRQKYEGWGERTKVVIADNSSSECCIIFGSIYR